MSDVLFISCHVIDALDFIENHFLIMDIMTTIHILLKCCRSRRLEEEVAAAE